MSALSEVKFLLQAASIFPPNGYANQLLKSHFLTTSRILAENELDLPKKEFGETRMCQKCSSIWLDGNLKLEVKSKKVKGSKQKKLLKMAQTGELLKKRIRRKANWLTKNSQSRVDITCLLCKNKTKIHLDKSKLSKGSSTSQSSAPSTARESPISPSPSQSKATKKKKKDKFAGLNLSAVILATTGSTAIPNYQPIPSTSSEIPKSVNLPLYVPKKKKKKNNLKKVQTASKKIKKKGKKGKAQKKQSQIATDVSKTQQKNTLQQLAQLLKSGMSSTNKNSSRLETLLRE